MAGKKRSIKELYQWEPTEKASVAMPKIPPQERVWQQPHTSSTGDKIYLLLLIVAAVAIVIGLKQAAFVRQNYLAVSFGVLFAALAFFLLSFEKRRPAARELVVLAVLVALGVAGRGAFFMLPQVKPVAALVILSGVAFGGEAAFLVGALTTLISNIFFTQGPWTPWQMLAFGLVGFFAGMIFQKGGSKITRLTLSLYGFFSCLVIYGGIVNLSSLLLFGSVINRETLLATYLAGAPMDLIHGISTVLFLWLLAKPLLTILQRVKQKYDLNP